MATINKDTIIDVFNMIVDRLHALELKQDQCLARLEAIETTAQALSMTEAEKLTKCGSHRLSFLPAVKIKKYYEGVDARNTEISLEIDEERWLQDAIFSDEFMSVVKEVLGDDNAEKLTEAVQNSHGTDEPVLLRDLNLTIEGHTFASDYVILQFLRRRVSEYITQVTENEPSFFNIIIGDAPEPINLYELLEELNTSVYALEGAEIEELILTSSTRT